MPIKFADALGIGMFDFGHEVNRFLKSLMRKNFGWRTKSCGLWRGETNHSAILLTAKVLDVKLYLNRFY